MSTTTGPSAHHAIHHRALAAVVLAGLVVLALAAMAPTRAEAAAAPSLCRSVRARS